MGYRLAIAPVPGSGFWSLTLAVNLTRVESGALFLSGDSMLTWPENGLVQGIDAQQSPKLGRAGMFISEVAARSCGLEIRFSSQRQAEHGAAVLREQLAKAGIVEEPE